MSLDKENLSQPGFYSERPPAYTTSNSYPTYPQSPQYGTGYNTTNGQSHTVVVQQPNVKGGVVYTNGPAPRNWLGLAIFSCLCCFWPTGLCAIVAAVNANSAAQAGDVEGANKSGATARNLSIASIILGIICITAVIVIRVVYYSSYYNSYN